MTMQHDAVDDLFGLADTFPRPGWVVLDAARDHRFTGELHFETSPPARVYFDRGHIYVAERDTDASVGARLVDAGALTATQLERGAIRIGEVEHLGHLFERVPSLDRHAVAVTAELMTEECVGWLAAQRIADVASTPYRHHESGMHRWSPSTGRPELATPDPLPAPTAGAAPVSLVPPPPPRVEPSGDPVERFVDGLIEWDEPSWLDGAQLGAEPEDRPEAMLGPSNAQGLIHERTGAGDGAADGIQDDDVGRPGDADWVELLASEGLPDTDPFAAPKPLPRLPIPPVDRFELVWPSGEIDESFGAVDSVVGEGHDPDADRVGATARLGRPLPDAGHDHPTPAAPAGQGAGDLAGQVPASADEISDEVVLAVRRAVASIEVGSLAARQRLADRHVDLGTFSGDGPDAVPAPGRVAVRSGRNDWSRRTVTRSVFDEPAIELSPTSALEPQDDVADQRERRAGALRRLISSLRR